jgi:hypothetical protein
MYGTPAILWLSVGVLSLEKAEVHGQTGKLSFGVKIQ